MSDLDPKLIQRLAELSPPEALDGLVRDAFMDMRVDSRRTVRARLIGFYVFLGFTGLAGLLALSLTVISAFQLFPVEFRLVAMVWTSVFGGGLASFGLKPPQPRE